MLTVQDYRRTSREQRFSGLLRSALLIKYLKRNASKNMEFDEKEEDWKIALRRILEIYVEGEDVDGIGSNHAL